MFKKIIKRDGRVTDYDISKIENAIKKAFVASNKDDEFSPKRIAKIIEERLVAEYKDDSPSIEIIQDKVVEVLSEEGFTNISRKYEKYREERNKEREKRNPLMKVIDEIVMKDANESDIKRENANIDGDTAMGSMLKFGSSTAKTYYALHVITDEQRRAHESGDIHIHDFDFYTLTTTCCQIDILKLFKGGFSTGHGFLREPNSIHSYAALACIAIQSNQNDQHGGQSIPNFDYGLAPGVKKTFKKLYRNNLEKAITLVSPDVKISEDAIKNIINEIEETKKLIPEMKMNPKYMKIEKEKLSELGYSDSDIIKAQDSAMKFSNKEIEKETMQAMEAVVHNLNTMHSRAGAQTPFSSINYGTDISPEGRLVIKSILLATDAGLGNGETPIFPIHIFKVKEGINYNPEDPNYDLFKLAIKVSAKRLFPNFGFLDAPFNKQYYKEGHPETEVVYMGCRTRVIGNTFSPENETTYGRGNLSFTSINLPRIAIKAKGDIDWFFEELKNKMDLVSKQLLDRFEIQKKKKVKNYPFLMGQGVWMNSDNLNVDDEVGEVLKHGTLSIGFIGLAETLKALMGVHHGENEKARVLGQEIVSFMRDYCDDRAKSTGLNFSLLATPAEGLSGRFVRIDKKKYGIIEGVTDRDYYTNSFHVPVYYPISAADKIKIEAPYHALTNAGHISYIELDGDPLKNLSAFEKVIRAMKDAGIGYGSINHPVDRDPSCGYTGIIDNVCPKCGRSEGDGKRGFERIRRITGYLVGTVDQFNDAKRAEEKQRVKHKVSAFIENEESLNDDEKTLIARDEANKAEEINREEVKVKEEEKTNIPPQTKDDQNAKSISASASTNTNSGSTIANSNNESTNIGSETTKASNGQFNFKL